MEDEFGVAYQQTADEKDLEYAFFGIFDGHGGREAALFAKEHLMDFIVRQKNFWAEDDESILKAIHEGFIQTHYAMWKELEKWPKTPSGLPSTAGTTASIAFIRRGKIYIGHVGDSAIVLGTQDPINPDIWRSELLTRDHKPESIEESTRIHQCGGKVICKSGVPRVVWNRPKMGHKGPVRRSTHIDEIPFLAVARSLGDLWSYNSEENVFVVSPEPDIRVYPIDINKHRCLVLGTDGAWNMLTPQNAISTICQAEKANEAHMLNPIEGRTSWINPSKQLVDTAIDRWNMSKLRADNTSVVTVMLDPPGPPRAQVLKSRKRELAALNVSRDLPCPVQTIDKASTALVTNTSTEESNDMGSPKPGISIISRFPNSRLAADVAGHNLADSPPAASPLRPLHDFQANYGVGSGRLSDSTVVSTARSPSPQPSTSQTSPMRTFTSTSTTRTSPPPPSFFSPPPVPSAPPQEKVQCNEISSSDEHSPSADPQAPSFKVNPSQSSAPRLKTSLSNELRALNLSPVRGCTTRSLDISRGAKRRFGTSLDSGGPAKRRSNMPLDSPAPLRSTKKSVASLNSSKSSAKRSLGSPKMSILNTPLSKRARMRSESASDSEKDEEIKSLKSGKKLQKSMSDPVGKVHQIKAKLDKIEQNIAKKTKEVMKEVKDLRDEEEVNSKKRVMRSNDPIPRTLRTRGTSTPVGSRTPKKSCTMLHCHTIASKAINITPKTPRIATKISNATPKKSSKAANISSKSTVVPKTLVVTPKTSKGALKATIATSKTSIASKTSTPKTSKATSKVVKVTPKSSKATSKGAKLTPKTSKATSKGAKMTPKTSKATSKGVKVTPKTSKAISKGAKVTPKKSSVTSKSSRGASRTPKITPKTSRGTPKVTPKTSRGTPKVTPKTSNVAAKTTNASARSSRVNINTSTVASKTSSAVKRKRTENDADAPSQKKARTLIVPCQKPKVVRGRQANIVKLNRKK